MKSLLMDGNSAAEFHFIGVHSVVRHVAVRLIILALSECSSP
jgi:hypothetical protein